MLQGWVLEIQQITMQYSDGIADRYSDTIWSNSRVIIRMEDSIERWRIIITRTEVN